MPSPPPGTGGGTTPCGRVVAAVGNERRARGDGDEAAPTQLQLGTTGKIKIELILFIHWQYFIVISDIRQMHGADDGRVRGQRAAAREPRGHGGGGAEPRPPGGAGGRLPGEAGGGEAAGVRRQRDREGGAEAAQGVREGHAHRDPRGGDEGRAGDLHRAQGENSCIV